MKGKYMKHLLLLTVILFTVYAFGANVLVGTNKVELAFKCTTLSPDEKAFIAKDIQQVLSTDDKKKLKQYNEIDKHTQNMVGYISVGTKGHHWPRAFWENDFGQYRINEKTSKKELIVPKKLVDAYRESIELKNKHPEAFASLDSFLKELNKGYHPEKMNLAEKKALFWFPPGMPAWSQEKYYDDNLREMKTISFYHPSVLTFKKTQIGNNTILYCKPVVRSKQYDSFDQMTLVYDGKRWRIGTF